MIRRPPRSTRTDTLFPYTTLFRSRIGPSRTSHLAVADPARHHVCGLSRGRPGEDFVAVRNPSPHCRQGGRKDFGGTGSRLFARSFRRPELLLVLRALAQLVASDPHRGFAQGLAPLGRKAPAPSGLPSPPPSLTENPR